MPTTSDMIVDTMIEAGTQRVYGLPGLGVTWTLPAFHARQNEIDIVLTRSEHIGAIMAQAAGLVTGRPGVRRRPRGLIQPASSNVSNVPRLVATARISSISARVTG